MTRSTRRPGSLGSRLNEGRPSPVGRALVSRAGFGLAAASAVFAFAAPAQAVISVGPRGHAISYERLAPATAYWRPGP
jgi:hypothetical protein